MTRIACISSYITICTYQNTRRHILEDSLEFLTAVPVYTSGEVFPLSITMNIAHSCGWGIVTLSGSFSCSLLVQSKSKEPVITSQLLVALPLMIRRTFWQPVFIHIWKRLMPWIASSDRGALRTSLLSRLSSWLSVTRGNSEVATVRTSRCYCGRETGCIWIVT